MRTLRHVRACLKAQLDGIDGDDFDESSVMDNAIDTAFMLKAVLDMVADEEVLSPEAVDAALARVVTVPAEPAAKEIE